MESTATIISTIISTFISSLIAVILYLKKDKMDKERDNRDKERDIKQQLDNILNIAIKYPFLEIMGL